jgi:hypothetical protein
MAHALLSSPPAFAPPQQQNGFHLLCACAASHPSPEQIARIATWNWAEFDCDAFCLLADHHGVTSLVAHNLTQHTCGLPAEVRQSLQSLYDSNLRRNLRFAAELTRIVDRLTEREVRVIPFKGPVLALAAYGELGLRNFSDLDFLIFPGQFQHAKQALAEIGYRPSQELAPAVERLYLQIGYERSFDGAAGQNLVELQWNLLPYFFAVDSGSSGFRIEDLFARAARISLGAKAFLCLSPEDSLLALCLHAAKHLWMRLIWLADIAETLRSHEIDFLAVTERARALGITRMVGVSFRLAERLLGAQLSSPARELIARDPEELRLSDEFAARIARSATYDFESVEYFLKIRGLRERPADRWRYLWRLVWTPGPGEVAAITLPPTLFPLYRAVRVGRLLRKLI